VARIKKGLSPDERTLLSKPGQITRRGSPKSQVAANAAIAWAEQHLFDRRSVVNEFELWRHALEHGRGQNFALKHVQLLTQQRAYVRNETHPNKVTTRRTLERERAIVAKAERGQNRFEPLNGKYTIQNASLDAEQRQAVQHILASQNFVTLFRGAAHTGKSFTLKQVLAYLARYTHRVAFSNRRLIWADEQNVTFAYMDYIDDAQQKTMTLRAEE